MKRVLSPAQEQAIQLCHHDHRGLSIEDAAKSMSVTVADMKRLLSTTKTKAPQLFPILTPRHRAVLHMYDQRELRMVNGRYQHTRLSRRAMAEGLEIKFSTLVRDVAFLRRYGFLKNLTMEQFDPAVHDGQVKEKF